MILKLVFLLVTLGRASLQQCNQTSVRKLMQGCKNLKGLTVYSQSGNVVVDDSNCGDLQQKFEFIKEPRFQFTMANEKSLYTMIIVDPDAPLMQENEVFLHIIRTGISGRKLKYTTTCCTNQGNSIFRYQTPTPPPGSGEHRYNCLLYLNLDGYLVQESDAPLMPSGFNLGAWLKGKGLCGPVAATQFRLKSKINY